MSEETAVPEEVLKEMSDDSGLFWLVGIVGVIIFVFFQGEIAITHLTLNA